MTAAPKSKRGRPTGSKDKAPRTKCPTPTLLATSPAEYHQLENEEISLDYANTGKTWIRHDTDTDERFALLISQSISTNSADPRTVHEAQQRDDWTSWEQAINSELDSLISRQVFDKLCTAQPATNLTGYRITLVRKRNAKGEIIRHKARLVAKGYTQIWGKDYDLTYAPVMDAITYRYLIAFSLVHNLRLHLMDVVTAYLYGTLDTEIFMQAPPELIKRIKFHIKGE